MTRPPLTFDRKINCFGSCKRINGRIGLAGEIFAQAFFSDIPQKWDIEILNADGSVADEYSVDASQDCVAAISHVEAIMNLAYRSATTRAAA